MSILMAGIDYNRAGVDIRSRFAFTRRECEEAYRTLEEDDRIAGSILLSTCNRTELWLSTKQEFDIDAARLLCTLKGLIVESYEPYLYALQEKDAEDHLFRLACGLESRILGEDQIISQVRDALGRSRESFATDHVLEVLFRQAVTAGKRVKTEVNLSTADRSVIHQAVKTLEKQGYPVSGKRVMVIGNGMMGKLAAQVLQSSGAMVTVTVRQYHSGVVEIPQGCSRINYEDRYAHFCDCDMVVSATSSPNFTLLADELEKLRLDHDVILIDLAVPRDIEPACSDIPGVQMYDIDSFDVDLMNDRLRENIRKAEQILEDEKAVFEDYYTGRDVLPQIGRLKSEAAQDISARLKPCYRKMALSDDQRSELKEQVEAAASRMMNKLLFDLKDEMDAQQYRVCLDAMEKILGGNTAS